MINRRYPHSELTSKVIGCAMSVHSVLGSGFQEGIYQRALVVEMLETGIPFDREKDMPIFYQKRHLGLLRWRYSAVGRLTLTLTLSI